MTVKCIPSVFHKKGLCIILAIVLCMLTFSSSALADTAPVVIDLDDSGIAADSPGVFTEGSVVTITLPGEYLLRGSLSNGQVIVDCETDGKVRLFLKGVSIHCENGPALHIKKCKPRLTIDLAEDTVNELSDGADYADKESNVDGVIFSKSDVTITGTGTLNITGAYRNGIVSKDDLRIKGGTINVSAVKNGIVGKDCVEIFDGTITVRAGNDGIKTTKDDEDQGHILMEGGTVSIQCGDDPLSFVRGFSLTGGTVETSVDPSMKPSGD